MLFILLFVIVSALSLLILGGGLMVAARHTDRRNWAEGFAAGVASVASSSVTAAATDLRPEITTG